MPHSELWEQKAVRALTYQQQADLMRALVRGDEPAAREMVRPGRPRAITFCEGCALEVYIMDTHEGADAPPTLNL